MKAFKKNLTVMLMVLTAGILASCTDYQDEIDALDYRVTVLENLVKKINSDLESLQTLASALEEGDYITNVTENSQGYIVTFAKAGAISIYDGVDGIDGRDGKDAQVPDISIKKGADGQYYWVINGEWLLDADGSPIAANGKDGKDGKDGVDGKDGKDGKDGIDGKDGVDGKDGIDGKNGVAVAPKVRINPETGMWEISVDDGMTWITTGTPVTGKDGRDGENGKDANAIVQVVTHWNEGYVEFITASGTFRVPLSNS